MSKSPKHNSQRYQGDKIDFIIPFLMNQTSEKNMAQIPSPSQQVKKTYILNRYYQGKVAAELENIAKIYNIPRKKTSKLARYYSTKRNRAQESPISHQLDKHQSNMSEESPTKSLKQRFLKVKSQLNHPPATSFIQEVSPMRNSRSYRTSNKKNTVKLSFEQSPILGVKFKSKEYDKKDRTEFLQISSEKDNPPLEYFKGQVRKKVKYLKEKKEWQKMRGMNVDSIVNRKCKNFEELILQYTRRMGLNEKVKIFVFESKDAWLRRVLIDRGWSQNTNTSSKAFHLNWSNKLYKQPLFEGQYVNHYPNCYNIGTKVGLFSLLRKYDLSQLQPLTFDISLEKNLFISNFLKGSFLIDLKKFLEKFQFEDKPVHTTSQQLLQQINAIIQNKFDSVWQMDEIHRKIIKIFKYCKQVLEDTFSSKAIIFANFNEIYTKMRQKPQLHEMEQQSIRILWDFLNFIQIGENNISHEGNVWMTKSKISSKGVGLTLHNQLDSILKYQNRLVQKYIEKPLIFENSPFKGRKFDLRIWVFLNGSSPQMYYHQQFYGRICFDSYSLTTDNLKNENIHLTNFNQNKRNFTKKQELHESIIFPSDLFENVAKKEGKDYKPKFYSDVQQMLRKLFTIFQLQIASKENTNCFQLFGCDILLDQNLKMYLLQINMSASCKERHGKLTTMLEQMGHGMMNILEKKEGEEVDLKGWIPVKC